MRALSAVLLAALLAPAVAFGQICTKSESGGPIPPLAVDDTAYVAAAGTAVTIPVLANDVVAGTGTLSIINVSIPAKGTAVKNNDNTITYTPNTLADDTFTYAIIDSSQPNSPSSQATVHVLPRSGFDI